MLDVSVTQAFRAGLAQLVSPALLPLIPFFVGYMVIASVVFVTSGAVRSRGVVFARTGAIALVFVTGFAITLIGLGSGASPIGQLLQAWKGDLVSNRARAICFYGTYFLVLRWLVLAPIGDRLRRWMQSLDSRSAQARMLRRTLAAYELIVHSPLRNAARFGFALLMGMTMGLMWIPLVGPTLAAILALAADDRTLPWGSTLLAVYASAMALPLFVLALAIVLLLPIGQRSRSQLKAVEISMGGVIALTGILTISGQLPWIAEWLFDRLPFLAEVG